MLFQCLTSCALQTYTPHPEFNCKPWIWCLTSSETEWLVHFATKRNNAKRTTHAAPLFGLFWLWYPEWDAWHSMRRRLTPPTLNLTVNPESDAWHRVCCKTRHCNCTLFWIISNVASFYQMPAIVRDSPNPTPPYQRPFCKPSSLNQIPDIVRAAKRTSKTSLYFEWIIPASDVWRCARLTPIPQAPESYAFL